MSTSFVKDKRINQLKAELSVLCEDIRSIIDAQEAANKELQSANEELETSKLAKGQ